MRHTTISFYLSCAIIISEGKKHQLEDNKEVFKRRYSKMLPDFDIICFATVGEATGSTSSRK